MLKTFLLLLGKEAPVLRRYAWMAVAYGVLCGLAITSLAPVLIHLLDGDVRRVAPWLALLVAEVAACWLLRRQVERAGVRVGVAQLEQLDHPLDVREPAEAELEVAARVGPPGQPLGLHARLERADLPHRPLVDAALRPAQGPDEVGEPRGSSGSPATGRARSRACDSQPADQRA